MNKYLKIILITIAIVIYFVFTNTVIKFFLADYYNKEGKTYLFSGYLVTANTLVNKAIKLNNHEPTYHRTNATVLIAAAISTEASEEDKKTLKVNALSELNYAYKLQKNNIVNLKNLIPMYYYLAIDDPSKEAPIIDSFFKESALSFYAKIENISPSDASMYVILGKYYRLLKEDKKAQELLTKALSLKPELIEAQEELQKLRSE